jgi:hypothetical protein
VCQTISGGYFLAAAQSLFANRMLRTLKTMDPDINFLTVLNTSASDIQHVFKGVELTAVLGAYMVGLKAVFALSMAASAMTAVVSLAIPFKKLPDHESEKMEVLANV